MTLCRRLFIASNLRSRSIYWPCVPIMLARWHDRLWRFTACARICGSFDGSLNCLSSSNIGGCARRHNDTATLDSSAPSRMPPQEGSLMTRRAYSASAPCEHDLPADVGQDGQLSLLHDRIGFIGAGQMAEALARGFISKGVRAAQMVATDPLASRWKAFESFGVAAARNEIEVVKHSDIMVIAAKPQCVPAILEQIGAHVSKDHLIMCIAAGVRLSTLERSLPQARVVRVMPNTPCLIGQAASAYALGRNATPADAVKVDALLSAVGVAMAVDEKMLDAVTGLSASGPAYVFVMIEALADGGVAAGLPRDVALALAAQTVVGAGRMVLESAGDGTLTHPAVLKDRVASPAGTTIAGLAEMETAGVRGALIRAVAAASRRSGELG